MAVSCGKEMPAPCGECAGSVPVEVRFGEAPPSGATRSLFDGLETPWPWESAIDDLQLLVFNETGVRTGYFCISPEAIASGSATVVLPDHCEGKPCSFYAVANCESLAGLTTEALFGRYTADKPVNLHNGTLAEVTGGTQVDNRFMMRARVRQTVRGGEAITLELRRAVAKVVLRYRLSDDFAATHPSGTLKLSPPRLGTCALRPPAAEGADYLASSANRVAVTTKPETRDGWQECIFYCYGSVPAWPSSRTISLSGSFVRPDGSLVHAAYSFPVNAYGDGAVEGNTCYRIEVVIKGLTHNEYRFHNEVVPWVKIPDHDITIG
jgi:hypothetical protein